MAGSVAKQNGVDEANPQVEIKLMPCGCVHTGIGSFWSITNTEMGILILQCSRCKSLLGVDRIKAAAPTIVIPGRG